MRHVLGKQFSKSDSKAKTSQSKSVFSVPRNPSKRLADAVYDQMTEDYPKEAVEWVHKLKWKGPLEVPIDDVDFDDKYTWKAEKEPDRVNIFKRRIRAAERKGEHIKPGILIQRPDKTAMIPDGHHRALAYKELDKPVYAWVGYPTRSKGPWDKVHDYQFKHDSGPQRQGNKGENIYR